MRIIFHGATQTVTGSCHEVLIAGSRILLDCGLFQGPRALARHINSTFDFPPASVTAVILSHGHADHCGNLPNLVKQGFTGPIYATPATIALTTLMLLDSAKIQEEDAFYLNKKNTTPPIIPLYTMEDAQHCIKLFKPLEYNTPLDLNGFTVEFHDAGHCLGSAAVRLTETATQKSLLFTGDVGRPNSPILNDPAPFPTADLLISECTYGGKTHAPMDHVPPLLAQIINDTTHRRGITIIPSFALGRTQAILFLLHQLIEQNQIPASLPIFIDSPLANRLTEVFRHFPNLTDDQTRLFTTPFDFPNLTYVSTTDQSRTLNTRPGPFIVIASSGMCEGGRILHHLKHHIAYPEHTVLFPGYQGVGTLGRKIQDRLPTVPILGDLIPLRCHTATISGLSAHADESELLQFIAPLNAHPPRTYLVHGELPQAHAHQARLQALGFPVTIPARGEFTDL